MPFTINSRILLGLASIVAAGALIIGATFAFFSDTETSTGNTFTAGELNLKVDSTCHYWQDNVDVGCVPSEGSPNPANFGNWSLTDLQNGVHKFFNFGDVKPGDRGENTISLHVYDNDAWARFSVVETSDLDVTCTEPESDDPDDPECVLPSPTPGDGELQEALDFNIWLDQGVTPGFQGGDIGEGDNIFNEGDVQLATPGPINNVGENYDLWIVLSVVRASLAADPDCLNDDPDGDGVTTNAEGACQGLPIDGHLVGSTTYYFGVGWELPEGTGNEVQSDNFIADMVFEVEQYRNNPNPFTI